jgi:hypothetical protein
MPRAALRYIEHAIAPGTPRADSVRLRMHGEIKLRRWSRFKAEEELHWKEGMTWRATAWMNRLLIRGFDRVAAKEGRQDWRLFGLFPVVKSSGPDIARSGAGRMAGESVWLPSVLADPSTTWSSDDPGHASATLDVLGEKVMLHVAIAPTGALESIAYRRWGNPDGDAFRYEDFGGVMEAEGTFAGYTIPTQLRMGWYFGTERFESEGEFIRITIDEADYS